MRKGIIVAAALLLSAVISPVLAGQNSMPVWDGLQESLRDEWLETASVDWNMTNDSGTWKYRWSGTDNGTSIANDSDCIRGAMWHYVNSTMEFGDIFAYTSSSDYYMVKVNVSSMSWYVQHWNGSGYTTVVQSVEGMSYWQSQVGWNPGNDSIVKMVWNGYNGTLRWKIWDLYNWSNGNVATEPFNWTIDIQNDELLASSEKKMGLYAGFVASGTNPYNDYGNIRMFNLSYTTESDSLQSHPENGRVPLLTVPEVSLSTMSFFEGGSDADSYDMEETAINSWSIESMYYDQDASHPNDTIYLLAGWNRTSANETYAADGMNDDLFIFWAHVTADNSFDNGTMGDYCRVYLDRNHNHVYDSGDIYISVWAEGDATADDVNGTWYMHNGSGWVEQQLYGAGGDAVYLFPAGLDVEAHSDDSEWMWGHLSCIAFREFESSPIRAEAYEQWMFMFPDRVLLDDDVNDFISLGKRIGINFYGYGTLAPVWSWSSWNATGGWYSGYEADVSDASYLGNLAVTGTVLGGGSSVSVDESTYLWVIIVLLVAAVIVLAVSGRRK